LVTSFKQSITRRSFLARSSAAALASAAASGATRAAEARQMNMLFLISDDLNNVLGCYGHPEIHTPNIDKFAKRSLKFDRAYCQFPLCNPSRSSMMTGLYPDETRVHNNKALFRDRYPQIQTMPQWFQHHGYTAARVGKLFHYGVPKQIGTDGLDDPSSWDQVVNPRGRDVTDEDKIFSLRPGQFGGTLSWLAADGTDEEQTDGIAATETIRLMEEFGATPFFLGVGFYRPHTPFVAPKKYFDLYPLDEIDPLPFPEVWEPAAAFAQAKPEQRTMTDRQRKEATQAYYASITFLDAQVGRVIDALEPLGLSDNTVVAFTSDHGYHLGEHGLWQKRSLFEESARVPLLLSAPGMTTQGQSTNSLAELVDLYPTFADCCGLPIPDHVSGVSLKPLLKNPSAHTKDVALTMDTRRMSENGVRVEFKGYSVRRDRWRYTEWDGGERGAELYDHTNDPTEHVNLIDDDAYSGIAREMKRLLRERLASQA